MTSAEQVQSFEDNRYLIVRDFLAPKEVAALQSWAQEVHDHVPDKHSDYMPYEVCTLQQPTQRDNLTINRRSMPKGSASCSAPRTSPMPIQISMFFSMGTGCSGCSKVWQESLCVSSKRRSITSWLEVVCLHRKSNTVLMNTLTLGRRLRASHRRRRIHAYQGCQALDNLVERRSFQPFERRPRSGRWKPEPGHSGEQDHKLHWARVVRQAYLDAGRAGSWHVVI